MINMELTKQEIINKQSEWIRNLIEENNHLKAQLLNSEREYQQELARIQQEYAEDREFMMQVIIAALTQLPGKRVTLFQDSPKNAKFALEPNISNDMIVILKSIL